MKKSFTFSEMQNGAKGCYSLEKLMDLSFIKSQYGIGLNEFNNC